MKVVFIDRDLEELVSTGKNHKYRRLSKLKTFMEGLYAAYAIMCRVEKASDLKVYSFLHYEQLKGNMSGSSSVRPCNRYVERLIFTEHDGGIEIRLLEINEKHYGKKK